MSSAGRLRWVVETLEPRPTDDVLELGGGNGAAAALVLDRLTTGTLAGIDRSPVQTERAQRRNAASVAAGRARFLTCALEEADFVPASFDIVFAASVNHFWTRRAGPELQRLVQLLRPGGRLWLFYEAFDAAGARVLEAKLRESFADAGLEPLVERNGRRLVLSVDA